MNQVVHHQRYIYIILKNLENGRKNVYRIIKRYNGTVGGDKYTKCFRSFSVLDTVFYHLFMFDTQSTSHLDRDLGLPKDSHIFHRECM